MKNTWKKLIALLLAVTMMTSVAPLSVFAADWDDDGFEVSEAEAADDTVPSDFDPDSWYYLEETPPEEPAPEEPEATQPEDPEEEPQEEEPEELEEEPEEEEEPSVIPFGFPGLPEGFTLTEAQYAQKAELAAHGVKATLETLTEGVDYAPGELYFLAEDEAYAAAVAEAYNAELLALEFGVATIRLRSNTVLEAMTVAEDATVPMPPVDPNYIVTLEPVEPAAASGNGSAFAASTEVPVHETWKTWYDSSLNPDKYLCSPSVSEEGYQYMHEAVDSFGAWGVTQGSGVRVGVLDTGVDASHPDFGGRVTMRNAGHGTGYSADHGTHVAGIIGATVDNGIGGAGIAPDVSIYAYRMTESGGSCSAADEAKAFNAAKQDNCMIINISFGGRFYNSQLAAAVANAIAYGITVVASAGNEASDELCYPAAYPGVISVASVDRSNMLSDFSNYGSWVTIAAPGTGIISTIPGGGYKLDQGTSMAAPVVAGICALYMAKMGWVTPAAMKKALLDAAVPVSTSGSKLKVVNAANMFSGDKSAPILEVIDEDGYYVSKPSSGITLYSLIYLSIPTQDEGSEIIFTLDGTNPGISNGQITNGYLYNGGFCPVLYGLEVGDTMKLKAAVVSGMGVLGKTVSLNAKILATPDIEWVKITAPESAMPGKVPLTAETGPYTGSDQTVNWSIAGYSNSGSGTPTIDKNGVLTIPSKFAGSVKVTAASAKKPSVKDSVTIMVKALSPVTAITLPAGNSFGTYECAYGYGYGSYQRLTPTFKLKDGTVLNYGDSQYNSVPVIWTSSNSSVVRVYEQNDYWYAEGVKKGSAKLTCKAQDGSNKSVSLTATVSQMVEKIDITGQQAIAAGQKATYKAAVYPTNASNKKVSWYLSGPSGVTVNASGTVSVPSNVTSGTIWLYAYSADGYSSRSYKISIVPCKCSGISLDFDISNDRWPVTWKFNSKWELTDLTLYTVTPYYVTDIENELNMTAYLSGWSDTPLKWSSSNTNVFTVNEYGLVSAVAPGTAKLTCAADDGSGKKASVNIKVEVPVSSISITPDTLPSSDGAYLAFGKSMKFKANFGTAYGTPTNKKVNWDYELYAWDDEEWIEWTDYAKANKLVTINSSGQLTVNKKLYNDWIQIDGDLVVDVFATTEEWPYESDVYSVVLVNPTTYLSVLEIAWYEPDYVMKYSDPVKTYSMYTAEDNLWFDVGGKPAPDLCIDSNGYHQSFTVKTSDPQVAGAYITYDWARDASLLTVTSGTKKGSAKITITANDGTKKSVSFTVKVR